MPRLFVDDDLSSEDKRPIVDPELELDVDRAARAQSRKLSPEVRDLPDYSDVSNEPVRPRGLLLGLVAAGALVAVGAGLISKQAKLRSQRPNLEQSSSVLYE